MSHDATSFAFIRLDVVMRARKCLRHLGFPANVTDPIVRSAHQYMAHRFLRVIYLAMRCASQGATRFALRQWDLTLRPCKPKQKQ